MLIGRKLNSLRHRGGFGIHSPFAFRFVTEVLCQRLPYYGYSTLGHDSRARLLLRLCVELAPATVALRMADPAPYAAAVAAADSRITPKLITHNSDLITPNSDLTVADASALGDDELAALARAGRHLMLVNISRLQAAAVQGAVPVGMTFYNLSGTLIAVAHSHLPRQDFDVAF